MTLPAIVQSSQMASVVLRDVRQSVNALHDALDVSPVVPPAASLNVGINFVMQHQVQDEWCWAAVSVSVALFYSSGSPWTQCSLVCDELADPTCCVDGSTPSCNQPWTLDTALTMTGNLLTWTSGVVSPVDLQAQLSSNRAVACRIGWSGGGGHFVVISNYRDDGNVKEVHVKDPLFGDSDYNYTLFQIAYRTNGAWTHSYYTTP
jgi:hypothetical protein